MNKFRFYFILMFSALVLFSCNKADDTVAEVPLRDYATQYAAEKALIETFMRTHYRQTVDSPGTTSDMDVSILPIPAAGGVTSLWDEKKTKTVTRNDVDYEVHYVEFRNGDPSKEAPSAVDNVLVAYDGLYLRTTEEPKRFEYRPFPEAYIGLDQVIPAWTEIFQLFKPGTAAPVGAGATAYNDFGAGVMFIPSGVGYYNYATATIPSYSSLMFTFKLYDMKRADNDGDGVLSIYEDRNGNGIFTDDDTDGDGIADYLDTDDDGDGMSTRTEIKNAAGVIYAFDMIPSCSAGGLKRYLDPSCQGEPK